MLRQRSRSASSLRGFPEKIILIGMAGVGKTAVGRKLAATLDLDFIDSDQLIALHYRQSISNIFAYYGEHGFRRIERQVITMLLHDWHRQVIAVGGGMVCRNDVLALLRRYQRKKIVWLQAQPDEIVRRLRQDLLNPRPLLQSRRAVDRLQQLLDLRSRYYRHSDATFSTDAVPVAITVKRIINFLQR